MKEWFTRSEIVAAGCDALPRDLGAFARHVEARGWHSDPARYRKAAGRGGGYEYHLSLLPAEVQARLTAAATEAAGLRPSTSADDHSRALWRRFDALSKPQKETARSRLAAVDRVDILAAGMTRQVAVALVAGEIGVSASTLWGWLRTASEVPRADRLAALAPNHRGRTATADCDPRAWSFLVADYLRPERPAFEAAYRRLELTAAEHGWSPLPSAKTLKRRIERQIPRGARVLAREGRDKVTQAFPHQTRDRSVFTAMEAVNADGHRFDVFVRFPDGTVGRPTMAAFQDLYSGMILAHRLDRSENWTTVRLCLADMVESFGIPEACWLDNGRSFASKWLTGGMRTRYRFKVLDDEPAGILTQLGVTVHWTTPYHGQAKPIERAFRDLCEEIARHPFCAGAYTGNAPDAKPENYGAKAVPFEEFRTFVAGEIARHNQRAGRRSATAAGRSFAETFRESFEAPGTLVRRATEEQRRMFLLAAEGVVARKPTGEIHLGENRYWAEGLVDLVGEKLVVRFDPQDLFEPVAVYRRDGRFVCAAECIAATGFNDIAAAREHARRRRTYVRKMREALALERTLPIEEVARLLPATEVPEKPEPAVIRLVANGMPRVAEIETLPPVAASVEDSFSRGLDRLFGSAAGNVLPFTKEEGGRG
jgi:transposase-like protein